VPDVGDESSSWEAVSAFYDFWYGFRSWREFPHPDEEDVEGAESREHKRWIERCVLRMHPNHCIWWCVQVTLLPWVQRAQALDGAVRLFGY
jgi:hypothetical protein